MRAALVLREGTLGRKHVPPVGEEAAAPLRIAQSGLFWLGPHARALSWSTPDFLLFPLFKAPPPGPKVIHGCPRPTVPAGRTVIAAISVVSSI